MTVEELVEKLEQLPQETEVYLEDWSEQYLRPKECELVEAAGGKVYLS